MANPLSAVPSPFLVRMGGRAFFGSCVWDGLGILAMLQAGGTLETSCSCCGERMSIDVRDGRAQPTEGIVQFAIPAKRWWENIVFTWKTMLLFRGEEHIDRWCSQWGQPLGATLAIEQAWRLAAAWYGNKMAPDWRRAGIAETEALLEGLGLGGALWSLRGELRSPVSARVPTRHAGGVRHEAVSLAACGPALSGWLRAVPIHPGRQ